MDEWKGWMQMVILVYHMTGANLSTPIYLHVRLVLYIGLSYDWS